MGKSIAAGLTAAKVVEDIEGKRLVPWRWPSVARSSNPHVGRDYRLEVLSSFWLRKTDEARVGYRVRTLCVVHYQSVRAAGAPVATQHDRDLTQTLSAVVYWYALVSVWLSPCWHACVALPSGHHVHLCALLCRHVELEVVLYCP